MVAAVVSLSRRRLPSSLMAVRAEDSSTMVFPEPPGLMPSSAYRCLSSGSHTFVFSSPT